MMRVLCLLGSIMFSVMPALSEGNDVQGGVLLQEFIYETAPFPSCHASTLAQASDQTIVAAWFGGIGEGKPDVGIWVSRKKDAGWSAPVEVANGLQADGTRHPCWNPVLFQPKTGPLLLFFKVGSSPSTWWGEMMISEDAGQTWKDRRKLPDQILGPIKNKPIQLQDGTLLAGSSIENDGWRILMERTPDLGVTWQRIGPLNGPEIGAIQPTLMTYKDGRIQTLCRDRNGQGHLWQSWSSDQGLTWTPFEATELPNPNAGADAVTLSDGRQLLVYNHTVKLSPFPCGREMLNVSVSEDGKKWMAACVLEKDRGEYSYPAVIQTSDGLVHTTYTWKRQKIRHAVIDPSKISLKKIREGQWPKE